MPETVFQIEAIGSIYAQALINEAKKQQVLAEVTEDVRGIGQLLRENPAFLAFTQALSITEDQQLAALEKIFTGRIHPLTLNVLTSMARRDRLMFLTGLVKGFSSVMKEMSGHVDVVLTTPSAPAAGIVERINSVVATSLGKTVDIQVKTDPALIGGMTLMIDDTLIDGSVSTQMDKIEAQLKRGGRVNMQTVLA